jgi:cytochrome b pre-mRNA-processing protein 3
MLTWLQARSASKRKAKQLYGAVVTAARAPALFARFGAADTNEGRYEVIVLHLFLVLERLRAEGPATTGAARQLIEAFVEDMDDQMREMGVGDLTVPRKVKKAAAALYDRAELYRPLLAAGDEQGLAAALKTSIPAEAEGELGSSALARYVTSAAAALARQPVSGVLAGELGIPAPAE